MVLMFLILGCVGFRAQGLEYVNIDQAASQGYVLGVFLFPSTNLLAKLLIRPACSSRIIL